MTTPTKANRFMNVNLNGLGETRLHAYLDEEVRFSLEVNGREAPVSVDEARLLLAMRDGMRGNNVLAAEAPQPATPPARS